MRIDNLLSISRSFVGGGSVPRSESPDGAGSYRTAPQGPLFRAQSRKSVAFLALPFFGASIPGFVGLLTGRGPFSPAFALIPGRSAIPAGTSCERWSGVIRTGWNRSSARRPGRDGTPIYAPRARPRGTLREPSSHVLSTREGRGNGASGRSYSQAPYLSRTKVPGRTFAWPNVRTFYVKSTRQPPKNNGPTEGQVEGEWR